MVPAAEAAVAAAAMTDAVVEAVVTVGAEPEWVEYWDESAGASYFFNTITQVIL